MKLHDLIFLMITIFGLLPTQLFSYDLPKTRQEVWQIINTYQKRLNPGTEIPQWSNYFTWKISGKIGTVQIYPESVPVYAFEIFSRTIYETGMIKIGTEIKLDKFINTKGRIYYNVPDQGVTLNPGVELKKVTGMLFVEGMFVERDDKNSFQVPSSRKVEDIEASIRAAASASPPGPAK